MRVERQGYRRSIQSEEDMGPRCPNCGKFVPFVKTQWGLGKTFSCTNCGADLAMPQSQSILGVALFIAFWAVKGDSPYGLQTLLLASIFIGLGFILSWLIAKPRLLSEDPVSDMPESH